MLCHVFEHNFLDPGHAAGAPGALLLAVGRRAGASHAADIPQRFCTVVHGLNDLRLGDIIAVANNLMIFHKFIPPVFDFVTGFQ
jgi:hypothetical protein